jgi:hypothetical protein
MTPALVAFAALAPWLSLLPLGGAPAVLAQVFTLTAAAHGAGLIVARLAHRADLHPLLAIQWGIATLIALSGVAIALRVDTVATQTVLICGFAGVHSAMLAVRWRRYAPITAGPWMVPACLLAALAVVHILGAAGDVGARPFDDDGNVLAQLQRLRDTGALGDAIGYARRSQLGGQLVLDALATLPGDVHLVRIAEALAFALALGLACVRIRPRDPASCLWAILVVITGSAFAFAPLDLATCWTAVGLIIALHAMIADEERPPLAIVGLVAGALIALRLELTPLALAALIRAWWPSRREPRSAGLAALGLLVVVVPYLAARGLAEAPPITRDLLASDRSFSVGRLGLFMLLGGASTSLVALVVRHPARRWLAIGGVVVAAGILTSFVGDRTYATRLLWPLAFACGLVAAIEVARSLTLTTGALLGSLVAMMLIHEGREATGRAKWTRRYLDLAASIEYVRHAGQDAPVTGGYENLLSRAPHGATIALWVTRPERLDYAAYRFVDLRTPRAARLRTHRWDAHTSRLEQLLATTGADYLMLEEDDRGIERIHESPLERFVCSPWQPACADDLEVLALGHHIVASDHGVRLIELRAPQP